jgi:hypothetical protein
LSRLISKNVKALAKICSQAGAAATKRSPSFVKSAQHELAGSFGYCQY